MLYWYYLKKVIRLMVATSDEIASELINILGADWFEKCVNHLNDAIVITEAEPVTSPGPRILWANEVFYKSTGYQPEEIIGHSPRILQGPLTDKSELSRLRKALKNC